MLYEYSSICEYHQKSSLYEYCEFLKKFTERTFLFGMWYFMAFTAGRCYSYNEFE